MWRAACLIVLIVPCVVVAEGETKLFESLYAARVQKALSTPEKSDDTALAGELLAVVKTMTDKTVLLEMMCDNIYQLGSTHADGYALAVEAMELLEQHGKGNLDGVQEKLLSARTLQTRQGSAADRAAANERLVADLTRIGDLRVAQDRLDDAAALYRRGMALAGQFRLPSLSGVRDRLTWVQTRQQLLRQKDLLRTRLLENANDETTARNLVLLEVRDLDQPAAAANYLPHLKDQKLVSLVERVALSAESLKPQDRLDLAQWYGQLAEEARDVAAKRRMWRRAAGHYEAALADVSTNDLLQTRARLSLQTTQASLERLGPDSDPFANLAAAGAAGGSTRPAGDGRWLNLLELIDTEKDVVSGQWRRTEGGIAISKAENPQYIIPVKPRGSYALTFKFKLSQGFIHHYHLPVGDADVILMLGNGSHENPRWHASGLRKIDGKDYHVNDSTNKDFRITANEAHTCDVRVLLKGRNAGIEVDIDGKRLIRWEGPASALGHDYPSHRLPDPLTLGIGALWCDVEYSEMKLRMVDGKADLLRATPTTPAPKPALSSATKAGDKDWLDLLSMIDVEKDTIHGTWKRTESGITVSKAAHCRLSAPVRPKGSYEVKLRFTLQEGSHHDVMLPAGEGFTRFTLGNPSSPNPDLHHSGLRCVNNKDFFNNETSVKDPQPVPGKPNDLHIRVELKGKNVSITSELNGKPFIRWQGAQSAIGHSYPHWSVPDNTHMGLGAHWGVVQYEEFKLLMLDGKAELLRPAKP